MNVTALGAVPCRPAAWRQAKRDPGGRGWPPGSSETAGAGARGKRKRSRSLLLLLGLGRLFGGLGRVTLAGIGLGRAAGRGRRGLRVDLLLVLLDVGLHDRSLTGFGRRGRG